MTTAPSVNVPHSDKEGQQSIAVTTSSTATSSAIGNTKAVVYSTVECFIVAGSDPAATAAAGLPVPANVLTPISGLKVDDKLAAIAANGSGTLYIRPGV